MPPSEKNPENRPLKAQSGNSHEKRESPAPPEETEDENTVPKEVWVNKPLPPDFPRPWALQRFDD